MNIFKRSLVASVATSFVVAGGLAPVVVALEDPIPGDTNQEQSQSYSLTIHKRIGANEEVAGYDGSALTDLPGADAGEGFSFSITQVTPATGADANNAGAATPVPGGHTATGNTDSYGKVRFENLPAGLYRVSETKAPDQYVKSQDFLVSVPVTSADGRTMINDVVAYPKNTEASVTKTVKDADVHGGSEYTYTIEANIPAPAKGDKLVSYRIVDNLDGRLAKPEADKVAVRLSDGTQTLVEGDYNVTITPGENGGAHTIEAEFNDTGLTKLEEARKAGQSVVMEIKATAPADVQVIPNKATQYFNNGNGEGELKRESDEVKTYWG
ncbi:surface-anchored protein [Corynebacterium pilosum]|uniref:Surface-anchored protein n=2 Tax=Corynebacterium pilosum TaxID=35756 RepID=A0A376CKU3_9CORY|nr:surface-anchored protein [Corynebacterium pilosum]